MHIVVVGAGDTGSPLVEMAIADGHDVVVIEKDEQKAEEIGTEFDCLVINDDAARKATLETAEADYADAVIVTTDDDSVNVMVCLLAKELGVPMIVSVVHNPAHMNLYDQIGVNTVENPQQLIAEYFYRGVKHPSLANWVRVGDSGEAFEIGVAENAPIAGHLIEDAARSGFLNDDVLIVAIRRHDMDSPIVPDGDTQILPNDLVTIYAKDTGVDAVATVFEGESEY